MPISRWHLQRLRAMSLSEMLLHARKKANQKVDLMRRPDFSFQPSGSEVVAGAFPQMPQGAPPSEFKTALARDVRNILAGRIKAFAHLDLKIDLPPRWHKDYLVGADLENNHSAFKINHRKLAQGAEIKLIWELSRWYFLVRLAEGAAILGDREAGKECLRLLGDWDKKNPAFFGWNWTSALETGMRLIQLTWIDRLLTQAGFGKELGPIMDRLLGPHAYYTWRYRTFGSSANNHLLGELAGLAVALNRWVDLAKFAAPLTTIHRIWEREVLLQFAEDGGNREQALNYHLFSFEFCWQTRLALLAAGLKISPEVEERLRLAGQYFAELQTPNEPWDYGDSDNAYVTPVFAEETRFMQEWLAWFKGEPEGASVQYWMGPPPGSRKSKPGSIRSEDSWKFFDDSGIAQSRSRDWRVRWDLSPLGFLSTAAHGHLDALHLTIWHREKAFVIDPGTGVYFIGKPLRAQIAGWDAHNAPNPRWSDWPQRAGPFLWAEHHQRPALENGVARLERPEGTVKRRVEILPNDAGLAIEDTVVPHGNESPYFEVRWQFAPGTIVTKHSEREFILEREGVKVKMELDAGWTESRLQRAPAFQPTLDQFLNEPDRPADDPDRDWRMTVCAPTYRQLACGPALVAGYRGEKPCVLKTAFVACEA